LLNLGEFRTDIGAELSKVWEWRLALWLVGSLFRTHDRITVEHPWMAIRADTSPP
jgi:hypothetical protein